MPTGAARWVVMATLLLSAFAYTLNTKGTILEYNLIVQALGTDHYRDQWVTGPAAIAALVTIFLPIYYLQVFGVRRLYVAGALCLGLGCLGTALAHTQLQASIAVVIRGGSALVAIPGLTLFQQLMPTRKGFAMSIYLAMVYGGQVVAEPLGALLAFHPSWRALFVILAAASVWFVIAGLFLFPDDRPATRPVNPFDWPGMTLFGVWLTLVFFLLYRGNYLGWGVSTPVHLAAAALAGVTVLFIWRELTAPEPYISLAGFGYRTVAVTMLCAAFWSAALYGVAIHFSNYLLVRGYEHWKAGWVMMPMSLLLMAAMMLGALIVQRPRYVWVLRLGLAGMTFMGFRLAAVDLYSSWQELVVLSSLWAVFAGLCLPAIGRLVYEGQHPDAARTTGAMKFFMRAFGGTAGVLIAGVILDRATAWGLDFVRTSMVPGQGALQALEPPIQDHLVRHGSAPPLAATQAHAVLGYWVNLHAQIIGYRVALRLCAFASGLGLIVAFFIRTQKEYSILDADDNRLPALLRGWFGRS
jgi:MFS family permease